MMATNKSVAVPSSRRNATAADPVDAWTEETAAAPAVAEPTKKLSLEFPESVHRITKGGAAMRGHTMIGEIVELCRARNGAGRWPADVVESVLAQVAAERGAAEAGSVDGPYPVAIAIGEPLDAPAEPSDTPAPARKTAGRKTTARKAASGPKQPPARRARAASAESGA